MGSKSWLVAGTVPGVERQQLKRLEPDIGRLIERWRGDAIKAGRRISRGGACLRGRARRKAPHKAVCLNWARTDPRGGRGVTCVSTAIREVPGAPVGCGSRPAPHAGFSETVCWCPQLLDSGHKS